MLGLLDSAVYFTDFDYKKGLFYGDSALKLSRRINYGIGVVNSLNVLADNYWYHSDFINAQKYYFKSYKLSDSLQYKKGIAISLYNIGWIICIQQHHYDEVHFFHDAYRINRELKDSSSMGSVLNALASCYSDKYKFTNNKRDFDSSLKYYNAGIELGKSNRSRKRNMAILYSNLGELFAVASDYKSALFYTDKSLKMHLNMNDSSSIVNCLNNKASYFLEFNNTKEAIRLAKFVYDYSRRYDSKEYKKNALITLSTAYSKVGEFEKAYKALYEYEKIKKQVDREAYSNDLQQMQNTDEMNKRETDLKQSRQENEIQELKNKRNTVYISVLIGVGFVIVIIAYLLFRQSKIRQLTNLKLKEQNKIISEKKHEIEQSIEYAKGIQTVFLPEKDLLNGCFKENFIFYKPKDVVSGDFYWFNVIKSKQEILIACADCTGHGVPGALMSMVGINTLHQLSVEKKIHKPNELLKQLNNEIKNSLKQNSGHAKQHDGMDIGLIKIDLKKKSLIFSGANRPLYLIRSEEVFEYKATKHAIGGFTKHDQIFDEIEIELLKEDFICMTTDGFADQFGGADGKKFMTKNFKKLISNISQLSSFEQSTELELAFNNWKGNYNQVDDVCVIGIIV